MGVGSSGNQSKLGGAGVSDTDPANMSQQQHSVLNAFDFAAIDEMDPALGKQINLSNYFS
jgi:hypothetical protein